MYDLIVLTNGRRDCISETIPSLSAAIDTGSARRFIVDDSGDTEYQSWLAESFPRWTILKTRGNSGFDGAYRFIWQLGKFTNQEYMLVCEDDFTFNKPIDVNTWASPMHLNPNIAQVALVRQPWNEREKLAGGLLRSWGESSFFQAAGFGRSKVNWLEHTMYFTTNPFICRTALMKTGPDWPTGPDSEGRYGFDLRREGFCGIDGEDVRFAYLGSFDDEPWVHHIGHTRAGSNY